MALDNDEKVLERAKRRRKQAYEADSHNRDAMVDDLRFCSLEQWPEEVEKERRGRPMLVLDKTNRAVKKLLSQIKRNRPSIKIVPVDSSGDPDTADVFGGLIRQIEQQSAAKSAYKTGANFQAKCGFGVWRIVNDFTSHDVFEQDLLIKRVNNPLNWWFDPEADELTKHDGKYVIGLETISVESYKKKYGDDLPSDFDCQYHGEGSDLTWLSEEGVTIAEYYEKVDVTRTIVMLSNGDIVELDEFTDEDRQILAEQGVTVTKEREVKSYRIDYYKLAGHKILDHKELPYRYFPVIPVYGEIDVVEGETRIKGIVRGAKDPQRLYNYWSSAAAETIALQPKAPYLVTATHIKEYKKFWDSANERNLPYLPYVPDPKAPPPKREAPPQMQAGLMQQAQFAEKDIQDATGIYETNFGAQSNLISGVAIDSKDESSFETNDEYVDNFEIAIEHTGRVLVDMIPYHYDTERYVRIQGLDGREEDAVINKEVFTPSGKQIVNDLTRGKYDIRTEVGPSYKTRRSEAANTLLEMIRVFPQLQQIAGDLLAKNLDIPGAEELEERFKKILPPGIIDDETPEAQAMRQQQMESLARSQQLEIAKIMSEIQKNNSAAEENMANAAESRAGAVLDIARAQKEGAQTEQIQREALLSVLQQVLAGSNINAERSL